MHENVEDPYKSATYSMHDSGIRMDEDFDGKPQDLRPLRLVLCGWVRDLGSLRLPNSIHELVSLRNPH